jgi:hypothetical protein
LVYAQTPDYLSNDPNWRQDWTFGGSMPCLETHNYIYYMNGDSLIGDVEYKKIYERHETAYNCNGRALLFKPEKIGPNTTEVDLSGLKLGFYILELSGGRSAFSRIKVTKQ